MKKPRLHQFVGIDVAKDLLDVHFHPEGLHFQVTNDDQGRKRLSALFAVTKAKRVVMESTGPYSRPLARLLAQDGIPVFVVLPQRVKQFASVMGVKAKTDKIDAGLITKFAQMVPLIEREKVSSDVAQLHDLVAARQHFVATKTANTNFTKALPQEIRHLGAKLREALDEQIEAVDEVIEAHVAQSQELAPKMALLLQMVGVGPVLGSTLLGLVPELGRCSSKEIASLIGLAPFNDDSGGKEQKKKRSIRGGRKRVRTVLYMAARAAVRYDENFKAFFKRLRDAGKPDKVALTAVMRKLVVIANAKMRDFLAAGQHVQAKA